MFFVEFILEVCCNKLDYRGERGSGLRGVGYAVGCEIPGWFCEFKPVVEGG